ncbi:MAG: hypothetical protein IKV48_00625 [Eggerthellaceae bacterium]|nr:hypothetical protein [Eggerthellaceae bacterium]
MILTKLSRFLCVAFAGAIVAAALVGCAGTQSATNDAQTENRQYMAALNQGMDELANKLDSFNDAVTRNDVVSMRTQAEKAFKQIDKIEAIEAPEALADVKEGYIEGCLMLESALGQYIDLYTQLDSGAVTADSEEYANALADIQANYDSGIAKLEETDKLALGL